MIYWEKITISPVSIDECSIGHLSLNNLPFFPENRSSAFSIMYAKWIQIHFMGKSGLILSPLLPNLRGFHAINSKNDAYNQKSGLKAAV